MGIDWAQVLNLDGGTANTQIRIKQGRAMACVSSPSHMMRLPSIFLWVSHVRACHRNRFEKLVASEQRFAERGKIKRKGAASWDGEREVGRYDYLSFSNPFLNHDASKS